MAAPTATPSFLPMARRWTSPLGTVTNVETLTGSTGNDTVTLSALQLAGLGTVNLVSGTDTLNVVANGNISQLGLPTVSNIDTGNLIGTAGTDSITLTGAQLDAILTGSGTINLGSGTGDTINLTSTSSDLNTLGATNASIQGVEAISAAAAAAGVTITLSGQTEAFSITGSAYADTITGGTAADTIAAGGGNDTIAAGAGNDTINLANGDFASGELIDGGANSDTIVLTNGTTVDFSVGTVTNVETLTGSTSSDTVTLSALQLAGLGTVNLGSGTDTLNVVANGNISQLALATMSNIDTGNLIGTAGTDSITLTGAQLNAILTGSGTINLGSGTGDTINLTSTSSDLNTLGARTHRSRGWRRSPRRRPRLASRSRCRARPKPSRSPAAPTPIPSQAARAPTRSRRGRQRHDQPGQRRLRLGRIDRWRRQQRHHRPYQWHDGGLLCWHGDEHRDPDRQHQQRHRHSVGIAAGRPRDRQPGQRPRTR